MPDGVLTAFSSDNRCGICPHFCVISEKFHGICSGREFINGSVYSSNYALVSSLALDPVEKKPLYHFHPSEKILSAGTFGCNMKCFFCQNWQISQTMPSTLRRISPEELVITAVSEGIRMIAFTYSEPVVWYDYVYDCASAAKEKNIKTVMVSNGFINEKPLLKLYPLIDAWNIDLKAFTEKSYQTLGGKLDSVKNTIEILSKKTHLELTTLVVPEFNDSHAELCAMAEWIASLDENIPWHLSRYFPAYKSSAPPTGEKYLKELYDEFSSVLNYVYLGNVRDGSGSDTKCPSCGNIVIERKGYSVDICSVDGGACAKCGHNLNIVFGGSRG
ncbi:MAG: AmmeMemoRadiSam system radical SAM enzyme [Spirochaetes bacterium]|nr:AmmeMemoRadiSam system radical SAM enzyme [Spirochaetota bacterium]